MSNVEQDDLDSCEACGKRMPHEDGVVQYDCTFCKDCYAEWLVQFNACEHEWEPGTDDYGDRGRCCRQCAGFVVGEDTPAVATDPEP